MALNLARLAFAFLALALLTLTASGLAAKRAQDCAVWLAWRWLDLADTLRLTGNVLLMAAALLVGLAATGT